MKQIKIKLRAIEPSDIDLIYSWENNPEVWDVSNTLIPFSRHTLEQYILSTQNLDIYIGRQLRLMVDAYENDSPKTVGSIDLFDFDPAHLRAGVGILIDGKERQKGYATEALKELIVYASSILHLHQLYCNILSSNHFSLKIFQSLGFSIIGLKKEWLKLNNSWQDEYMLQLLLQ